MCIVYCRIVISPSVQLTCTSHCMLVYIGWMFTLQLSRCRCNINIAHDFLKDSYIYLLGSIVWGKVIVYIYEYWYDIFYVGGNRMYIWLNSPSFVFLTMDNSGNLIFIQLRTQVNDDDDNRCGSMYLTKRFCWWCTYSCWDCISLFYFICLLHYHIMRNLWCVQIASMSWRRCDRKGRVVDGDCVREWRERGRPNSSWTQHNSQSDKTTERGNTHDGDQPSTNKQGENKEEKRRGGDPIPIPHPT